MDEHSAFSGYGLWLLVIVNSIFFIVFAFSFAKPRSSRDWRSLGAFSAFIVALFTEMYGFPLTLYLAAPWLQNLIPGVDIMTHNAGHFWPALLGWRSDPHFTPIHWISDGFIIGGLWLLGESWIVLHRAQAQGKLAVSGPYKILRHPQYVAFILVMIGFLVQWPTIITALMFPVLVVMYVRLAKFEEREAEARFGEEWRAYAARTPGFIPRLGRKPARATAQSQ
ncbi:MAG: isoprenylcysteine carboxylmethyltransferase family protein [Hydrogenophilaceae bacterium]|jgi:protein-S-isoprenylcysteine O-methyltransferase Ste14|nr:isoprenylcysteine carboxylmethyltransferase family protein [Hydrogenophilaceae bacterium]